MRKTRTKLFAVGIVIAAVNLGGCAAVAKEVVHQVLQNQDKDEDDKDVSEKDGKNSKDRDKSKEDGEEERSGSERNGRDGEGGAGEGNGRDGEGGDGEGNGRDSEGGDGEGNGQDGEGGLGGGNGKNSKEKDYSLFIQNELEPRLGTAKNREFSYGFEFKGNGYAAPMTAALDSGIISTYRRDLNKDGQDELLVIYMDGSKQSADGKNHFLMGIYGDSGNGITEWGRIGFDDCFSEYNGEECLFGLKDVGNKRLIYAGRSGHVWTWADGSNPEIHLYHLENSQVREIYSDSQAGSDPVWMPQWRSELQGFGFEIPNNYWSETDLSGESGFEVLVYGESYTKDLGNGNTGGNPNYWIDNGRVVGGIYGPDSQQVMQMNMAMKPYAGGNASAAATPGGAYSSGAPGNAYAGQAASAQTITSGSGSYILPNSSTAYLTRADLAGLSQEQLRLARNEIYARHGRKFKTKEIQDYFNSKSWYTGTIESNAFKDEYLNIYEKENIKLIQSLEN